MVAVASLAPPLGRGLAATRPHLRRIARQEARPHVPGPVCTADKGSSLGTRLARVAASLPQRVDLYFERAFWRRALWWGTTACAGFYLANTVSLSFGALAVNDIVSAALSVAFVEYCTRTFYAAGPKPPFSIWLLNAFKLGFTYGLICDAFKLGG